MDASKQPYPEVDFCSRCNDHAEYTWCTMDFGKGMIQTMWLSKCCDAPPVEVDPT